MATTKPTKPQKMAAKASGKSFGTAAAKTGFMQPKKKGQLPNPPAVINLENPKLGKIASKAADKAVKKTARQMNKGK
jgi:hypothetical protein